jgi:S-methylmethionine-dependent homocysteine/selenocysteine methylase
LDSIVLGILFNCSEPESITKALQHINNDKSLLHRLHSNGIALGAYANRLIPIPDAHDKERNDHEAHRHDNINTDVIAQPHPLRIDLLPEQYYVDFVRDWVTKYNVHLIGGCCGITPAHIAVLHEKFNDEND